jgi:hypothetical protein
MKMEILMNIGMLSVSLREIIEIWTVPCLYSFCFWYQFPLVATCLCPFSLCLPPISCTFPLLCISSWIYSVEIICGLPVSLFNTVIGAKPWLSFIVTLPCEIFLGDRAMAFLNSTPCIILEFLGASLLSCMNLYSWSFHIFSSFFVGIPFVFCSTFCPLIGFVCCPFLMAQNLCFCIYAIPAHCMAICHGIRAATTDLPYKIIEPLAGFCLGCPCCLPIGGMTYSLGGLIMTFWNGCSALLWTLQEAILAGTQERCLCLPSISGLREWCYESLGTMGGRVGLCARSFTGMAFCPNSLCLLARNFNGICYYCGIILSCPCCCCSGIPIVSCTSLFEGCGLCTSWWSSLLGDWLANQMIVLALLAEELVAESDFFDSFSLLYLLVCRPIA